MMIKSFVVATTVAILGTTGAFAQGFSGGSIGIEYSELDELSEFQKTTFDVALEYELSPRFAIAGNLSYYSYADIDDLDLANLTLHGIYALNSDLSVGLWASRDNIDSSINDVEIDNYGLEAAYASGAVSIEGYVGADEADDTDLPYFGIDGDYGFGNGFSVIGRYDSVSFDEGGEQTYATAEIGAAYTIASGPSIFETVGNLTFEGPGASEDDTLYSIGASYNFGGAGGTTFGSRGFLELPFTF
jgi:hypothetical protein